MEMSPPVLGFLLSLSALLPRAPGGGELEHIGQLLASSEEKDCREGTDVAVSEGSVAAVELLLDVPARKPIGASRSRTTATSCGTDCGA
jgi:hypothetical protein